MNRNGVLVFCAVIVIILIAAGVYLSYHAGSRVMPAANGTISIVAAENFYGDIATQLGGSHVTVKSILSNPNVDPHEYESSVADGIAVADANIVIENGLSYDTWMDKLLSASPNASRTVITASDVATRLLPENPHVWYGIDNIGAIAQAITSALKTADPADAAEFDANFNSFNTSLTTLVTTMSEIKMKYGGTPIGLTETIALYQTGPMQLNVLTPLDFERAIAEGNDPSAASVATTNAQVNNGQVKVLIYNSQTVTPITTNLQAAAQAKNIPVVAVTETMPSGVTYQTWMMDQLTSLEQALALATGK